MCALIDEADSKRRCLEKASLPSRVLNQERNARYGLMGERVGEASHPGPARSRDEDEGLDNLEFALTMIDSDDEPLTRHEIPCGGQDPPLSTRGSVPTRNVDETLSIRPS